MWAFHLPHALLSDFMGLSLQFSEHPGSKADTRLPALKPLLPLLSCFLLCLPPSSQELRKVYSIPNPRGTIKSVSVNHLLCQLLIPGRQILP